MRRTLAAIFTAILVLGSTAACGTGCDDDYAETVQADDCDDD